MAKMLVAAILVAFSLSGLAQTSKGLYVLRDDHKILLDQNAMIEIVSKDGTRFKRKGFEVSNKNEIILGHIKVHIDSVFTIECHPKGKTSIKKLLGGLMVATSIVAVPVIASIVSDGVRDGELSQVAYLWFIQPVVLGILGVEYMDGRKFDTTVGWMLVIE
ncbi:MAG: hypothetical protein KDC92_14835 [Bacteroidetes bacterium]|nr:hypothetical protein [Bacteroidota bacterium]